MVAARHRAGSRSRSRSAETQEGESWAPLDRAPPIRGRGAEHGITTTAQALAYSLFLAIPSTLLVVLGVFSLVASPSDVQRLIDRADADAREAATLLSDSLERSTRSRTAGSLMTVVGAPLALWTTTSAATTLMQGVTTASTATSAAFPQAALALVHRRLPRRRGRLVIGLLVLGPHLERWVGDAIGAPAHGMGVVDGAVADPRRRPPVRVRGRLYLGPDVEQPTLAARHARAPSRRS